MSKIKQEDLFWCCRFHPTDWYHEVGCPHCDWTKEQLLERIYQMKQFHEDRTKQENFIKLVEIIRKKIN